MSQSEVDLRKLSELALENVRNANTVLQFGLKGGHNIVNTNATSDKYPSFFAWKRDESHFVNGFKTEYQERFTDQASSRVPSTTIAPVSYSHDNCDSDDSKNIEIGTVVSSGGVWKKSATGGWILEEVDKIPVAGVKSVPSLNIAECLVESTINSNAAKDEYFPPTVFKVPFADDRNTKVDWITEYDTICMEFERAKEQLKKDKSNNVALSRPAGVPSRSTGSISIGGSNDIAIPSKVLEEESKKVDQTSSSLLTESRESFGVKKLETVQEIKGKNYSHKYSSSSNISFGPLISESSGIIADDWILVDKQPAGVEGSCVPSEISLIVSSDDLEGVTKVKFGKKQFPDKYKSGYAENEHEAETGKLKFGKKQFPTKRLGDSAPILDIVQLSVAPKPRSETMLSYKAPQIEEPVVSSNNSSSLHSPEVIEAKDSKEPLEVSRPADISANITVAKPKAVVSKSVNTSSAAANAVSKSPVARKSILPPRRKAKQTVSRSTSNPLFLYKRYNQPSDNQLKIYTSESQSKFAWKSK